MPKKGQKQSYKVSFQYEGQPRVRRAHYGESDALYQARDIARRGASVQVHYVDPATGASSLVVDYTTTLVPDDDADLL